MAEILTLSRALKMVFEDARAPISDFLRVFFPQVKVYQETEIPVDRIEHKRLLASYREQNAASNLVAYQAGKGEVYNPPALAESSPINETLAHSIVAGLANEAPAEERLVTLAAQIRAQHDDMISRAIVKQAVDIMTTGEFQPVTKSGAAVGSKFTFGRDPANSISANYSANPVKQWQDAYDQYVAKSGQLGGLVCIAGTNWLSAIEKNADFIKALEIQRGNVDQYHNLLQGGNSVISPIVEMKIPGRSARCTVVVFNESYENASGVLTPFIDPNGLILTSLSAPRAQVYAGVYIVNELTGQGSVQAGQLVTDAFWSKDPDMHVLRSQSRPILVPGNVDHIVFAKTTTAYA